MERGFIVFIPIVPCQNPLYTTGAHRFLSPQFESLLQSRWEGGSKMLEASSNFSKLPLPSFPHLIGASPSSTQPRPFPCPRATLRAAPGVVASATAAVHAMAKQKKAKQRQIKDRTTGNLLNQSNAVTVTTAIAAL